MPLMLYHKSQPFFQKYESILPTSLTHIVLIDQRLLTLETCCGFWYGHMRVHGRLTFPVYRGGPLSTKRRCPLIRTVSASLSKLLSQILLLATLAETITVN